jgi:hypothetical protein
LRKGKTKSGDSLVCMGSLNGLINIKLGTD